MSRTQKLKASEWVQVKTKEELLATLNTQGQLDGLPFMPEMFRYCGQRFQVAKSAHKTCDPPNSMQARRMPNAVHLADLRCDGAAHGGCQAGCLIFWKDAWLKRVDENGNPLDQPATRSASKNGSSRPSCTEQDVYDRVHPPNVPDGEVVYACQSTMIAGATTPLPWWDLRQYVEDVRSGNVRIAQLVSAFLFFIYHTVVHSGIGIGAAMRWTYDNFQRVRGGTPYPWRIGRIPKGAPTPAAKLDLQPGERVRVRTYGEILETLNDDWKNRGMYFDGEMVPFCNGSYDVLRRVEKIIDEKTGKMVKLKNDAIILKDVACEARYAKCRRFCSRAIYPYWREIWLERVR